MTETSATIAHEALRETVRAKYAAQAQRVTGTAATCCEPSCCGGTATADPITGHLYATDEVAGVPEDALKASLGCGNPTALAELKPGETVLDLGSGAGLDAIIASWQVGPGGRVVGVDLNPAMCVKAQAHVATTGMEMECREGSMEDIPFPDASVDAVISNGVINLSFRKRRVVQEIFRVLRPGGRISITDIVSAKQLSQSIVNDPKLWAS
jgi:arsenite methyltransferase